MAYMDRNTSLTDEHRTMDTVRQEIYDKLYHYKRYIEDAILSPHYSEVEYTGVDIETDQPVTKTRKGIGTLWARWAEFKSDPTAEQWRGLTQGNAAAFLKLPEDKQKAIFRSWYFSSDMIVKDHYDFLVCSGQLPFAMVSAPGIGKTSIIEDICKELGLAYVIINLAGKTAADLKGLPFNLRDSEGNITNDIGHAITSVPWSRSAIRNCDSMTPEQKRNDMAARIKRVTPPHGRHVTDGPFAYTGALAPEFGVLFFDEFTSLNQQAQIVLQTTLIKDPTCARPFADSGYYLPPFWKVCAAMNSATEGGIEKEESDMIPSTKTRFQQGGFWCVHPSHKSAMDHFKLTGMEETWYNFIEWSHQEALNKGLDNTHNLPDIDRGLMEMDGANPRNLVAVSNNIKDRVTMNAEKAWREMHKDDAKQIAAEEKALQNSLAVDVDAYSDVDAMAFMFGDMGAGVSMDKITVLADDNIEALDMKEVEDTGNILAMRGREMANLKKELSCEEYLNIIKGVTGNSDVADNFQKFYLVRRGTYGAFRAIEGPFKEYLRGNTDKAPSLAELDLGGKKPEDNVNAIVISCDSFLKGVCADVRDELYAELKQMMDMGIEDTAQLEKAMTVYIKLLNVTKRATRWLVQPKYFTIPIKEKIMTLASSVNSLSAPGASPIETGTYMNGIASRVRTDFMKHLLGIKSKAASKKAGGDDTVQKINQLLMSGVKMAMFGIDTKTWTFIPNTKKDLIPGTKSPLPFGLEDPGDKDFITIAMQRGDLTKGNLVSEIQA